MLFATDAVFALKGAAEDDVNLVQKVLDGNKKILYYEPEGGPSKAIAVDSFDSVEGFFYGVDLSDYGLIKFYCEGSTGEIRYAEEDRKVLLEQLVLMFTGYRFMDLDFFFIDSIFHAGCRFYWTRLKKEKELEQADNYLRSVLPAGKLDETDVLLQITDVDFNVAVDILHLPLLDGGVRETLPQIISTETEGKEGILAVFIV